MIFNGRLRQRTGEKDGIKILLAEVLVFMGVALVVKAVLSIFSDVEFLRTYQSAIMLILALMSVNIPALWYINRTFQ